MKSPLPVVNRKGAYYLRKTFEGKQREISLGTNKKVAESRAIRFLATVSTFGYEAALEELNGKPVIKAGANPTFEEINALYLDYCQQSAKAPREATRKKNLERLKFLMKKMGISTVDKIDQSQLYKKWFANNPNPSPAQERTFASAISAASGVFKVAALKFYESKGNKIKNPFNGFTEFNKPKVKQYVPMSEELRNKIWNDCQTELKPCETMIVLMALGIGMRISEINASIPSWFSKQSDKVIVHIKSEKHFIPKANEDGLVPISLELYELLLKFRANSPSKWFVPFKDDEFTTGRLRKRFEAVNQWLHNKGFDKRNPLHSLRKECGSIIARKHGILEASKILRNTVQVASVHYTGIAQLNTVEVIGTTTKKSEEELLADKLGISLEDLKKKLGME